MKYTFFDYKVIVYDIIKFVDNEENTEERMQIIQKEDFPISANHV